MTEAVLAIMVAIAAPFTSKSKPHSKINIGAKMIFTPAPITIEIIAILALPSVLAKLLKMTDNVKKIKPIKI
jgi:hypothetical protein